MPSKFVGSIKFAFWSSFSCLKEDMEDRFNRNSLSSLEGESIKVRIFVLYVVFNVYFSFWGVGMFVDRLSKKRRKKKHSKCRFVVYIWV